ncbi:MAG: 1-acylglycerol-3-phosphate O-acyltransferase [Acidobacteria bacterium]|nr:1-acylglycerol-3-phosphate O-acyltransferase [Acidobacteriota bacterium]NIM61484.1 1-acylglycerol-3-phosphate O-acyltransferase [Acidobacteriota bacterium]NIO58116.1 1-acylglycerol-3-phosphate O-acyltransferase [Acidobacteriota bacterium]NIQ29128.1 1-acylglycerol-3-phosphate O-acyltransferase [Acidobacteriota bacterium]NIQ83679.1 1-acylglycerol-3-phosphate O-acyltransferase [Acidobacteriota bacterium]
MTLRGLWTGFVMAVTTVVCASIAAIWTNLRPGSDVAMVVGRVWGRLNYRAAGARLTYESLDTARAHTPCIYISNHQSNVDIWALIAVLPKQTRFVAKQSLFKIPLLGWALRVSDFIPIDRANRSKAIRSLDDAAAKIRGGRPVVLFAEGTRSAGDTPAPFKKGPFHLALAAGVPIVPVAISGSGAVMPPRGLKVRPGPVTVRFCDPIDVEPYRPKDVQGLLDAVHAVISRALAQ